MPKNIPPQPLPDPQVFLARASHDDSLPTCARAVSRPAAWQPHALPRTSCACQPVVKASSELHPNASSSSHVPRRPWVSLISFIWHPFRFFFYVLWDLKKTKCENGGNGISASKFFNFTNQIRMLFSSALRFFISLFFPFILPSIRSALTSVLVSTCIAYSVAYIVGYRVAYPRYLIRRYADPTFLFVSEV